MELREHRLDNGLTVRAECNPDAHFMAMGFFVRTGARDESPELNGVSHFLEHMVFKGTPHRSAEQVNLELDRMGSNSNAQTGEESTIYYAGVLPEFQTRLTELLSDLMRPSLRDDDFNTERQVIIEEIMMYLDQPPYGGQEVVMQRYFGDHPLGQSVLGTEQTISAMTPDQMREYFRLRYNPTNMAVAVAGNVDFDRLIDDLNRCCGEWKPSASDRTLFPASTQSGLEVLPRPQSTQSYILQLAPAPDALDPQRYAASTAVGILGDEGSSRLFWEFLDTGLAESAGMSRYAFLDNGTVATSMSCRPELTRDNLVRLRELQLRATLDGFTPEEFELAKRRIETAIALSSERTASRMFMYGNQWLRGEPMRTVAEIAHCYDALTLDEVNAVRTQLDFSRSFTLIVGPHAEGEFDDLVDSLNVASS